MDEAEWKTRRDRIDKRLRACNPPWQLIPWQDGLDTSRLTCHAVTEFPTANGPAHYALFAEQQEIVRRVEILFALADQLEARFASARAPVDRLTPSLLARAFSGKLVPQDPNDEPAEKLLERIRKMIACAAESPNRRPTTARK